ncbi:MAG: DUF4062 domain-containing protein [Planctomycetaceae bacterium]
MQLLSRRHGTFSRVKLEILELIQKYIDQCDYFVMVTAGIYGSLVPGQDRKVSYVEWEYDYAQGQLPCFSFIYSNLDNLLGGKLEREHRKLLDRFHEKVRGNGKNVAFYSSAPDLNAKVLHALQQAPRHSNAVGWVRADSGSSQDTLIGTWALRSSNVATWQDSRVFKIYSATEFIWLQIDQQGAAKFIWGTYTRDG